MDEPVHHIPTTNLYPAKKLLVPPQITAGEGSKVQLTWFINVSMIWHLNNVICQVVYTKDVMLHIAGPSNFTQKPGSSIM